MSTSPLNDRSPSVVAEFPCNLCEKSFKSMSSRSGHMKTHAMNDSFPCHLCGKGFKSRYWQRHHIMLHYMKDIEPSDDGQFHCPMCDRSYKSLSSRTRHIGKAHFSNEFHPAAAPDGLFPCNLCGRRFKNAHARSLHSNWHIMHDKTTPFGQTSIVATDIDKDEGRFRNY